MNSQLGSAKYHEKEDHGIVHVVSRKRKLSGREFKKLLVSRVKRVKAIDHAHGKQDRLSESGCSVSGTNEPSVTNMRVAESSCSNSKEERLDDSLQECSSTCNLQMLCWKRMWEEVPSPLCRPPTNIFPSWSMVLYLVCQKEDGTDCENEVIINRRNIW